MTQTCCPGAVINVQLRKCIQRKPYFFFLFQAEEAESLETQLQVLESFYTFAAGKLHTFKVGAAPINTTCLLSCTLGCLSAMQDT